jgi:hypothetical protein
MKHPSAADAVSEVMGPQCRRGRHDYPAEFHYRQHRLPKLDLIVQHHHDPITASDAAAGQRCGEPIRARGQVGEGIRAIGPVRTDDA